MLSLLGGCGTLSTMLTRMPDAVPNFSIEKIDGEIIAINHQTGESIIVTENEIKFVRKLPSNMVEAEYKEMFDKREEAKGG